MNTLFLTLLYDPDDVAQVRSLTRGSMQNQINTYQWAFIDGLRMNMGREEKLQIVNALPVGIFPLHYRQLWLRGKRKEAMTELPSLNLPWFKQKMRAMYAKRALEQWVAASPENRNILVYSLYLPYMEAVAHVKRRHPDVRATIIVTDLPNELGIASGRKGLLKWIEFRMGEKRTSLCTAFDGFVLLTRHMAEALPIDGKPTLVIEGLASPPQPIDPAALPILPEDARPAVLYTGTLNRELGIDLLLDAFAQIRDAQLWLCGHGDMSHTVQAAAAQHDNILYFGFVPQETALALQDKAAALINPRTSQGIFTRYSFPSKTMEYLRSGKPVLCCKLDGIPDDYDPYLTYIKPQTALGIQAALAALLAKPPAEREAMGQRGKAYVLHEKSSQVQCAKLLGYMRTLHASHIAPKM